MMLDLDITVDQNLFNTIQQYNFSVIPVYRTNKNRVLGVVRIKHLLGVDLNAGLSLKDCAKMEPVHFVPEGRNLLELYDVMKSRKGRYFFVVKDENRKYFSFSDKQQGKAITGMINMKIILEEITLKQFADQDQQKAVSSGEFAGMVKKKKPDELLEEGVEQD
jgi:CBS domain containing-hemolysin-like protein